ncbi:tRNA-2-methylthio-N(6)-dimethylallyladenosine synthase [Rickettsiales bacterium]|nr:tRNA-2-methylthio-N(6)-dimethylallyladenosine synthase [Rickettsiales bacterium]
MNVYDSIKMQELLLQVGFEITKNIQEANLIILNTCHIREKATEKLYSELGRIKVYKHQNNAAIAVAGCVAQAEGEEIFARAPFVDIVVGPQSIHTLPDLIKQLKQKNPKLIKLDFPAVTKFDYLPEENLPQGVSAFLSIQEGCDKFCRFCVVPYTRGAEYSRPVNEIYREALQLAAGGAKEITLLGQNVNAYHGTAPDGTTWNLGKLIMHLAKIKGIQRIRYTTSHPRDMHNDLYEAHATEPKLMPFLHLPVQSGSDRILKAMGRKHTAEKYLEIIQRLHNARKDIAFSSDFIVGYPGETEADFEETLALIKEVRYAQCYSFKYSPRPGTPAANLANQIPEEVKSARLRRLQDLTNTQQKEFNHSASCRTMPVLIEYQDKRKKLTGRSPYMQLVHIENCEHGNIGQIVNVLITSTLPHSLIGEIISENNKRIKTA